MTRLHKTYRLPVIAAIVATVATPVIAAGDEKEVIVHARANALVIGEDADHVIEMRMENGDVTVIIDGEEIAQDRIRTDKGRVLVLDEDGNEIKSLNLFMNPGNADFVLALPGGQDGVRWEVNRTPPTVMIGVHLADPGDALRKHLRLDAGEGSMISGLYEGLAAQRAGLQQYDVIIAVEGEPVVNPGTIMEALAGLEAGDEVTFSVVQSGRRKQFTVTADAFDPTKMDPGNLLGGGSVFRMGIPNLEFEFAPGEDFKFKRFLVDPAKKDVFVPGTHRFRWRGGDREIDDRLHNLNEQMEELHEMIDRLVKEAQQRDR